MYDFDPIDPFESYRDTTYVEGHVVSPDINLSRKNMKRWDFSGKSIWNSRMDKANLAGAKFRRAKLNHVDFTGADLRGSDFTGVDLRTCYVKGANFAGAIFAGANLEEMDFTSCNMTGVDLSNAKTGGAKGLPTSKRASEASRLYWGD